MTRELPAKPDAPVAPAPPAAPPAVPAPDAVPAGVKDADAAPAGPERRDRRPPPPPAETEETVNIGTLIGNALPTRPELLTRAQLDVGAMAALAQTEREAAEAEIRAAEGFRRSVLLRQDHGALPRAQVLTASLKERDEVGEAQTGTGVGKFFAPAPPGASARSVGGSGAVSEAEARDRVVAGLQSIRAQLATASAERGQTRDVTQGLRDIRFDPVLEARPPESGREQASMGLAHQGDLYEDKEAYKLKLLHLKADQLARIGRNTLGMTEQEMAGHK